MGTRQELYQELQRNIKEIEAKREKARNGHFDAGDLAMVRNAMRVRRALRRVRRDFEELTDMERRISGLYVLRGELRDELS